MQKIEVLIEEYKLTNEKIEQFIRNQHQYLNTALIIIGGLLFFGLSKGTEYLNYLPILTGLIIGFIGFHFQRTIGLQGYKIYLEKSINNILQENVICYAQIDLEFMVKKNRFSYFNLLIYIALYVMISLIAYNVNPNFESKLLWIWIYIGLFVIIVIAAFPILGYAKKVTGMAQKINQIEVEK